MRAEQAGERIERLLAELTSGRDRERAEELVGLLVRMYGDALARVAALLRERQPELLLRLSEDDLVESLLLLHDLHPLDVDTRIQRALDRVRPYLGSHAGGVEYLGVDGRGVARLRLEGSCHGCPSSAVTVRTAIEGAVQAAAPEIVSVEVSGLVEPPPSPLLQIGTAPPPGFHPPPSMSASQAGHAPASSASGWSPLPELGPPTGRPVSVSVEGVPVLVCSVRGTLYAYRDACAACGSPLAGSGLAGSGLDGAVLTCPACRARFDVRLAGRGVDDAGLHLDPLPLLSDSQGTRVAVPPRVSP
jgi:Fe-S cluster biogenesis protein NfuA/nitrite reductase/ring-hydroxylating ferredoxin subunit